MMFSYHIFLCQTSTPMRAARAWPSWGAAGLLLRNRPKADRQPIPPIDRNNSQRQVNQFLLSKMLAYFRIDLVRHVLNGNQGHCLRPCQSCPLTLRIERSLTPGKERINALFSFATRPRSFGMQINSIRTPVDL